MKILFIGNSYTYYNDMPSLFLALAETNGKVCDVKSITKGGRKLYQNLSGEDEMAKEIAALPQSGETYDACVLQENSTYAIGHNDLFRDGVKGHVELLSPVVARFYLYETWSRKEGSPTLEENGWTTETMTEGIASAYREVGRVYGAETVPVGEIFYTCVQRHPEIELYHPDKSHPSYTGSALSAIVHYRAIFGEAPKTLDALTISNEEKEIFLSLVSEGKFGGEE